MKAGVAPYEGGQGPYFTIGESAQCLLAALCVAAATCWPLNGIFATGQAVWWLQLLGVAWALTLILRSRTSIHAGLIASLFATIWLCTSTSWLYVAMHTYGGLNSVVALAALVLLSLALSSFYAFSMYALARAGVRSAFGWSLQCAALWSLAELARSTWLTGFGWGAIGYGHVEGPLAVLAPWVGVHGVGFVAVWGAAMCAAGLHTRNWLAIACALTLIGLLSLPTRPEFTKPAGSIAVTLLQGNIPQNEKFEAGSGVPLALKWYAEQLQSEQHALVVAPETAIPLLPTDLPPGYWDALHRNTGDDTHAAMLGIPLGDSNVGYSNSIIGISSDGRPDYRYDKHHLVPFGEFIPPWFRWFTQMMNIPLGDFNRGALGQASFEWHGQRLAPNICYEDLFGEELGQRFTDTANAPTIFVNISNLGWFGDTVAIDQHLQISRMRALEFQRPFLRATNTGSTQVLDYQARTQAQLPRFTRGVLRAEVQGRSGITPYAWWVARFGLWPCWLFAGVLLMLVRRSHAGS